ncbi:hypothetical protein C789_1518 [Microcystis aeruginosa FACHB-905 = DIANCHI905]|nr:hypothetical protein C789_1518 [Microcystis aeruginosa FACHB-905 = DIANCHI905]
MVWTKYSGLWIDHLSPYFQRIIGENLPTRVALACFLFL